jgi:hypothetical protein
MLIKIKKDNMDHKNPLKMIDPVTGMEMTMQPPMPANQMGTAKPMFNQTTQNVAQQVYGGLDQRQMSMGAQAPVFMKSPLNDNHPGNKKMGKQKLEKKLEPVRHKYKAPELDPDFRNPGGNTNMTRTLTEKPKETTSLRKFANILTGGLSEAATEVAQHVKNYNYTPQETFTKVKTDMPKKRVNGGDLGYVIDINTGKRIPTTTITRAQNILKKNK